MILPTQQLRVRLVHGKPIALKGGVVVKLISTVLLCNLDVTNVEEIQGSLNGSRIDVSPALLGLIGIDWAIRL